MTTTLTPAEQLRGFFEDLRAQGFTVTHEGDVPDDLTAEQLLAGMEQLAEQISGAGVRMTLPACPAWCEDKQHSPGDIALDLRSDALVLSHSGPSFGPFLAGGEGDVATGEMTCSVDVDEVLIERLLGDGKDPESLRALAWAAGAAADWLEAQR